MEFRAAEIAQAVQGRLVGPDTLVTSVSIDSRSIEPNALFVPIVADRDGHDWIDGAVANGATVWFTSDDNYVPMPGAAGSAIVVGDTTDALADLARHARGRLKAVVIGITGSVGKTSVKDLAAAAIGGNRITAASDKSFNNELGVPLTICNAPADTEVLIVEMGARGLGHIAHLCEIARPTIGIVTWVGAVHTSEFGDVATVATAKAELVRSLPSDGVAILNADCAEVAAMADCAPCRVVTYGELVQADLQATGLVLDDRLRGRFTLHMGDAVFGVELGVSGAHQVSNALAALAAASVVEVPMERAAGALGDAAISPWRMEIGVTGDGATIINDSYNANAISTSAALRSLAALDATRRIAVLGTMAELGDRHQADHQAIADLCSSLEIELVAFGESAYGVEVLGDLNAVVAHLGPLHAGIAVLIKGSRVAGLERLAATLLA